LLGGEIIQTGSKISWGKQASIFPFFSIRLKMTPETFPSLWGIHPGGEWNLRLPSREGERSAVCFVHPAGME
jgi:hypothetical protein